MPEIPAIRYRPAGRSLQLRYGPLAESDQFKRKHQPTASLARHGGFPLQKCAADSSSRGTNGAADQETALLAEGVEVGRGSLGERTVDFSSYGWFPEILPSDADDEQQQQQESMNA